MPIENKGAKKALDTVTGTFAAPREIAMSKLVGEASLRATARRFDSGNIQAVSRNARTGWLSERELHYTLAMAYTIAWVGTVAIGLETPGGRSLAFSLEENQTVPPEFRMGDLVRVSNHPDHPANLEMGFENQGYYEIEHVGTGTILRTYHRADSYKVE